MFVCYRLVATAEIGKCPNKHMYIFNAHIFKWVFKPIQPFNWGVPIWSHPRTMRIRS